MHGLQVNDELAIGEVPSHGFLEGAGDAAPSSSSSSLAASSSLYAEAASSSRPRALSPYHHYVYHDLPSSLGSALSAPSVSSRGTIFSATTPSGPGGFTPEEALAHLLRSGYAAPTRTVDQRGRGRVVIAGALIPRGAFVCEYIGQLVDGEEGDRRHALYGSPEALGSAVKLSTASVSQKHSAKGRGQQPDAAASSPSSVQAASSDASHSDSTSARAATGREEAHATDGDTCASEPTSSSAMQPAAGVPPSAASTAAQAESSSAMSAVVGSLVGSYMFFFVHNKKKHCLDATAERKEFGIGRIVSHSRKVPNCRPQLVVVDGVPRIALMARRDVPPGEELCYDYGERDKAAVSDFAWLASS